MTFLNICEILLCIMCFYPLFFFTNTIIVSLYTFIVLLSYLIVVICISVPVCTLCVKGDKIQMRNMINAFCIFYYTLSGRPCLVDLVWS